MNNTNMSGGPGVAAPLSLPIEARIEQFMSMIGVSVNPMDFLNDITKPAGSPITFDYYNFIKPYPKTADFQLTEEIHRGAAGIVFKLPREGSIVKIIPLKIDARRTIMGRTALDGNYIENIIKECFIQYLLNTDVEFTQNIPALYGIYSGIFRLRELTPCLIIHMEQLDKDLYDSISDFTAYPIFSKLIRNLIDLLGRLFRKYEFVHRDLKADNIMLKGPTRDLNIIDFGFSAMTIRLTSGAVFRLVNSNQYAYDVACDKRQDMIFFFVHLREELAREKRIPFDTFTNIFLNTILPGGKDSLYSKIVNNSSRRRLKHSFHGAYNLKGELTKCPDSIVLFPEHILVVLNSLDAHYASLMPPEAGGSGVRGGKRRKHKRKTKKHSRVLSKYK